ncbi:poly [ADP-ribose] polymerase tankyrase-like [Clavelina lepadiformis]|uniref:poly [ADP-ribose] polymerase tankyrase-like n=1 Tax=Clavelina lepadiformis TaxID=159417 RepID=UPI004042DA7B
MVGLVAFKCVQVNVDGVQFGALIEIRDELQRTALIHAAMNGHYPVITYLLHKGADQNVADSSNNSAIHYAAAYGWYHCVLVLLQASANPDVYNDRKMPPIGVTLLKDHRETAHLLAEHHADAYFRDERGRTIVARLLAEEPLTRGLFDRTKKLEDQACPLLEALVMASKSDVSTIVGKTRRNYRNPNDEGKSAAHYLSKSAIDKECKVLACLLRHKPKLDLLDSQGASPLITTLLNRKGRAEQMLLDAGAQPNFCSNNPKHKYPIAPLTLAVARHGPGDRSLLPAIRALLQTISDIKLVPPDPRNGSRNKLNRNVQVL